MSYNVIQVKPPQLLTVKSLREYLDSMEKLWTEEDTKYLGEFNSQKISIPYFKEDEHMRTTHHYTYQGYGPGMIHYDGGLDFIIEMPNPQQEQKLKKLLGA